LIVVMALDLQVFAEWVVVAVRPLVSPCRGFVSVECPAAGRWSVFRLVRDGAYGETLRGTERRWGMTTSGAEQPLPQVYRPRRPSLDEQARARGTRPIESAGTYALDGVWESDDEVDEFIRFTRAARQAEIA
jgi:hypothetical protein